jgi:hypothetical protein
MTDLNFRVPTNDYNHERGWVASVNHVEQWFVEAVPEGVSDTGLFSPTYPKVVIGEPVDRWQLRLGNGFVVSRPTADECMSLARIIQSVLDGHAASAISGILDEARMRPETWGPLFVDEATFGVMEDVE